MAQRKSYNPNTAYGKRKLREQADKYYNELPPNKQKEFGTIKFIILLMITLVMVGLGFLC